MNRSASTRPHGAHALLERLPGRWCLVRDSDLTDAGDVELDVLVDADRRTVRDALVAAGARPVRSWGRSPHRQFTAWDAEHRRSVRLDIVDELSFGRRRELRLDARDAVLAGVECRNGWSAPTRSSEQWLALFHALLDRVEIRDRDIERMSPWVASVDDAAVGSLPRDLIADLDRHVRAGDWDAVGDLRDDLRLALAAHDRLGSRLRAGWRGAMMRTIKLQRAILRPGPRVALLGPDGAGKSTTIDTLVRLGVVESSVYLGVAPTELRRQRSVPGLGLLTTIVRLQRGWLRATVLRRRGHPVALDRHPLEATIGPPTSKRTTLVRRWILAHALPRPELVVLLVAPADELYRRKPDIPIEAVVARRDRYLDLAERHGFVVVDTTASADEVVAEIRRAIHEAPNKGRTR